MRDRGCLWLAAALAAGGCAAPREVPVASPVEAAPAARGPVTLRNPGFELDTPADAHCARGWNCTMHGDPKSFRFFAGDAGAEGRRSFCIEPLKREPWALMTQGLYDKSLRGARLRFSIALRLTGVNGQGAGPWAQVVLGASEPRQTHVKLVKQAPAWETQSVEFDVPAAAELVEVGVMLRGTGRACFDDARLEMLPAKNPV